MIQKSFLFALLLISMTPSAYASESSRVTPIVEVFKKASPSVVNVSTEKILLLKKHPFWGKYGQELDSLYDKQPEDDSSYRKIKTQSIGSGVIIHKDGLIITNAHVIHRANSIYVTLYEGTSVPARLIAINAGRRFGTFGNPDNYSPSGHSIC
jgi:S1-C subfamily serine protease